MRRRRQRRGGFPPAQTSADRLKSLRNNCSGCTLLQFIDFDNLAWCLFYINGMMFLTTQPLWLAGILVVGLTTLLAMAGPIIVRRRVGLGRLKINNEVAGFKFATVGVLYAVMLGFAVIVVWEKFSDADNVVAQEAGAAATIYRLAGGIGGQSGKNLRDGVTGYMKLAIAKDWPAMERGSASPDVTHALDDVYAALFEYNPEDRRGAALLSEVLHQLDLVTQARRARLVAASGIVPGVIWLVLLGGAAVTIGFTFFFGAENLQAQTMMTGALSILICSGLLIIVVIDHPFAGAVKVGPDALSIVLEDFSRPFQP